MAQDLLADFEREVERAEEWKDAPEEERKVREAWARQDAALRVLEGAYPMPEATEGMEVQPPAQREHIDALRAYLEAWKPTLFDKSVGDDLIGGIGYLLKIPGMIDADAFQPLLARWAEAVKWMKGASLNASAGPRVSAPKVDFKVFLKREDGRVQTSHPASDVNLGTQVNRTRNAWFGPLKDLTFDPADLNNALTQVIKGDAAEVKVEGIGTIWREALAG